MESLRDVMRCGSSLRHHEPGSINKRPGKNQRCEPVKRQLPCFIHAAPRYPQGTRLIASSFQLHCRLAAKTADDQTVQTCTFTLMMQASCESSLAGPGPLSLPSTKKKLDRIEWWSIYTPPLDWATVAELCHFFTAQMAWPAYVLMTARSGWFSRNPAWNATEDDDDGETLARHGTL